MKVRIQLLDLAIVLVCFLDDLGAAFASIPTGPFSQRSVPLHSIEFRQYLHGEYDKAYSSVPGTTAYREVIHTLQARAAASELPRRSLDTRLAFAGPRFTPGIIYLNLANDSAEAVEISDHGWNLRPSNSTHFRASTQMLPLPTPEADGPSLDTLLETLTGLPAAILEPCRNWLISALRPTGPYPILILKGATASGKSTLARLLRLTLDPSIDPIPNLPNTPRRFESYAGQHRILAFDHVTHIPRKMSDVLCSATKPLILTAPDRTKLDPELTSRAIILELPEIQPERRRSEAALSAAFHTLQPQILGALCTLTSHAIAHLGETELPTLPRHADAALWIAAATHAQPVAALDPSAKLVVSPCKLRKSTSLNNSNPIGRSGGSKPASTPPIPPLPVRDSPSSSLHPT